MKASVPVAARVSVGLSLAAAHAEQPAVVPRGSTDSKLGVQGGKRLCVPRHAAMERPG